MIYYLYTGKESVVIIIQWTSISFVCGIEFWNFLGKLFYSLFGVGLVFFLWSISGQLTFCFASSQLFSFLNSSFPGHAHFETCFEKGEEMREGNVGQSGHSYLEAKRFLFWWSPEQEFWRIWVTVFKVELTGKNSLHAWYWGGENWSSLQRKHMSAFYSPVKTCTEMATFTILFYRGFAFL